MERMRLLDINDGKIVRYPLMLRADGATHHTGTIVGRREGVVFVTPEIFGDRPIPFDMETREELPDGSEIDGERVIGVVKVNGSITCFDVVQ